MKESEKTEKYLDPARELKKKMLEKMRLTVIIIGALGTVPQSLVKKTEGIRNANKN